MESQTSFIPKKSLAKDTIVREVPVGFFTLISTVLFFASLFSGIGVYFYKNFLNAQIKQNSGLLQSAQKAFDPTLIVELERIDKRIESAKGILTNHIVVSPIFKLLETSTIPSVRFNTFSYSFSNRKIEINMSGQARNYAYVALQSDVLGKNKYFLQHIFSDLNLDGSGNVTFNLSTVVSPTLLSYKSFLERADDDLENQ
ncbi:MAG: hypothetical protein AAB488_02215 [Patescibacteria group bacterium]